MDWTSILENALRGFFGESAIFFALAAIGLNIHFGYTGLLNFGQAVFMAAGAYGLAITVATFEGSFWLGCFMGLVVFPVLFALILGVPTLRLRADYLAIVTIASAEIFRLVVRSPSLDRWTGSSDGLNQYADAFYALSPFEPRERYGIGPLNFLGNQFFVVLVGWATVLLVVLIVYLLVTSPWGRVLKAIREDEDAARSLGKNAYWYKMQALILGGMIGAAGGMLRAIGTQSAQPQNFITEVTFLAWVALILGGAARVLGPVIGAMILWGVLSFTDAFLREGIAEGLIPEAVIDGTQVGEVRFMLIGLTLALLAAFRPQGIFGNRNEMALDDR